MKKLAKCLWLAVVAVLFFSIAIFVSCSDGNSGDEKKPSLSLLPAAVTLEVGESVNLTAELSNTEGTVTYVSSASEIATVDAEGTVTAVSVGNAVITATCNDLTAECRVTVEEKIEEAPVCFISFVPTELTVYGNTPYTFTPQLKSGDEVISGVTFAYTADDTAILKVDGATITGLKNGTATVTISCEYNGQTVTAQVEVEVIDLIYVTIENSFKVVKDEQANIDGISVIVNGESIDASDDLAFTTENETIAKIQDGKILGVARGTTKLTVTYGEASAVCDITVFDDSIGSLEELKGMQQDGWYLLSANIDAAKNNDYLLNSFSGVLNGNGYAITNVAHPIIKSLTGTLENMAFTGLTDTNITDETALLIGAIPGGELHNLYIEATVSKSVQAVIVGDLSPAWEGNYVVTDAAVIDNCVVKVSYTGDTEIGAVAGGSWFGGNTALTKSILVITDSENVEIMRTDGFSTTGSSGTVENCEVYSLTEYKGLTAVPAWIAQMLNAGFIEDTDGVPVLESKLYGTISETSLILVSGGEGQLTVNAYKNHQNVAATVEWTSSAPEKVAVENGKLTAKQAGTDAVTITATIKYGDETITLTCSVLVGELTLSGEDWTTIDTPINMKAEFNEEDISGEVTWSVSDNDIATIDADGKLTFTAHGNITVTATYMGISVEYEAVGYDGTVGSLEDMSKMSKTGWYIMTDNIDANNNTGYLFNFTVEGGTSSDFDGLLDGNGYAIMNVSHPILNGLYGTIRNIAFTNVTDTHIGDAKALVVNLTRGGEIYNVYIEATLSESTAAWGILTDDITPYWTGNYQIEKATWIRDVVIKVDYKGTTKIGAAAGSSTFGGNTAVTERVLVITDSQNIEMLRSAGFAQEHMKGTVRDTAIYSAEAYKELSEKPAWIAQMLNAGFIEDADGVPVLESKLYGTISETSLILVSGGEGQLTVNAYKNHQKVAATVEWTSSAPEKVAVDTNGKLTAKQAGTDAVTITATIKYGDETITLTCSVLVGELTLSGDDWTTIDKPINMKAEFNEEDISGEVTWSVSDDDIATIDADGKLTFNTHGNITVTATYMGISVEYEVVCYDGTVGSLEDMSKMSKTGWYIMTDNIDANNNTGYLFNFTVEGGTSSDFDGLLDGNGYAITNVSHPILNGLYGTIRNIAFTNVTDTNIGETHALIMRAAAGGEIYNVYIEATLSENTTAWGILTDDITPYWTTGYVIVKATVVRDVVMNISYTGDTKIGAVAGSSWFGGNTALTERVLVITDSENVEIMRTEGFTVAGSSGTVQNYGVYSLTEYKGLAEKPEWIAQLYEKGFSDDENGIPVLPEKQVQA